MSFKTYNCINNLENCHYNEHYDQLSDFSNYSHLNEFNSLSADFQYYAEDRFFKHEVCFLYSCINNFK